jgi:ADP-ribose pyrophosphatase
MTSIAKPNQIPDTATKVFAGVIHDVYHYPQIFYDGSTQTMEKIVRPDSVLVIPVLANGNILMSRQTHAGGTEFTSFFGGRVEAGEDALEGAKRELAEESGLTSQNWKELYCLKTDGNIFSDKYCFVAYNCQYSTETKLDLGEKISVFEIRPDQLLEQVMDPVCREQTFKNYLLEMHFKGEYDEFISSLKSNGGA